MKRLFPVLATAVMLATGPAQAAGTNVDAAVKTLAAVGADSAKLATYCDMSKEMAASGEKASPESDAKIDGYIKTLGSDFESAWNAGENLPENAPDAQALGDAIDALEQKCPS